MLHWQERQSTDITLWPYPQRDALYAIRVCDFVGNSLGSSHPVSLRLLFMTAALAPYAHSVASILLLLLLLLPQWEFIHGPDLLECLNRHGGALSEDEAAFYFCQLLRGLLFMHQTGFAHRDLKPENCVLQDSTQVVKVWRVAAVNKPASVSMAITCDSHCLVTRCHAEHDSMLGCCWATWHMCSWPLPSGGEHKVCNASAL